MENLTSESTKTFKLCTSQWLIGLVPVLIVFALVFWTYYVYVFLLCLQVLNHHLVIGSVYLAGYHIVLLLFLISYLVCIFTDPGSIPVWYTYQAGEETMERKGKNGGRRYCAKCQKPKPDRCHHCRICERCILKMDHHCPWVNNCVGFANYKPFVLFLGYTMLLGGFVGTTMIPEIIKFDFRKLKSDQIQVLIVEVIAAVVFVGMMSFYGAHFRFVFDNVTTIEWYEKRGRKNHNDPLDNYDDLSDNDWSNPYDLGKFKNFKQVFGDSILLWAFPIPNSVGDGCQFPVVSLNNRFSNSSQESATAPILPRFQNPPENDNLPTTLPCTQDSEQSDFINVHIDHGYQISATRHNLGQ